MSLKRQSVARKTKALVVPELSRGQLLAAMRSLIDGEAPAEAVPCLKPGCKGKVRSRGLCDGCKAAAWRAMEAGETTEEELIRHGKLLPKLRNTRVWLLDFKRREKVSV